MARADERDDGGGLHEIEMTWPAAEESPDAVAERGGGTQRHERVHVRSAALELAPCAAEKTRPAHDHHRRRKGEPDPLEPVAHAPAEEPFANDERQGERRAQDDVESPTGHRR